MIKELKPSKKRTEEDRSRLMATVGDIIADVRMNGDAALLEYLAYDQDKIEKLLEDPTLLRTPIVRNGKQATVGYQPDIWKGWE